MNINKIELVNPFPELEGVYRQQVKEYIDNKLITLKEWNTKFKYYRDDCGYSIIHYLGCCRAKVPVSFMTINPIMLKNRKELVKRFKVKIIEPKEMLNKEKKR